MSGKPKKKSKGRLGKGRIAAAIVAAVVCLIFAALAVTNAFVPVVYLSAYMVAAQPGERGVLTVTFLDVGYGDCTLCELPDGKILLIDGGDGSYPNNLAILRKLNSRGIDCIDYLVCSSPLGEYCGGLVEIVRYKQVKNVFMPAIENEHVTPAYAGAAQALRDCGAEVEISRYGAGACGEDYFFTFLSPSAPEDPAGHYSALDGSVTEENIFNVSAILWLEYAGTSFAFASSAGGAALSSVVDDYKLTTAAGDRYAPVGKFSVELTSCDVVSVPGHGREECTSAKWYAALTPDVAVISVGENYSGYPSPQAVADIGSSARAMLTSHSGDIAVKVTERGYEVTSER